MSDCCSTASPAANRSTRTCPACQNKGKSVQVITMRSLMRPERRPEILEIQHYYCPTPTCDVVYFSAAKTSRFYKDDLAVRVGAKETVDPIPVCYCFGHTEGSIREEIEVTGKSSAEESIRAAIEAGECACETSNPAGVCCLGDVRAATYLWLRKINERCKSEEVTTAVDNRTSAACCEPIHCRD